MPTPTPLDRRNEMFDAHVLNVLISAPGDTGEEVVAVKKSLRGFNSARAWFSCRETGSRMLYRAWARRVHRA
jgi:hypothetical protein